MSKPATSRLRFNPPLGRRPVLQNVHPDELEVDSAYQRSLENKDSQTLVRRIAQHWNWDLCQPLVVARRRWLDDRLFVIDGQHRLAAARLRGDIADLPCTVVDYASTADEAASFVHLNQQRKPLSRIDLFKAAVASEDPHALAILSAIEQAGLRLAPHLTTAGWKPGMVGNIGGIEASWRKHGEQPTRMALRIMAVAFKGQVLQYAGTIFPGIAAVVAQEMAGRDALPDARFDALAGMLASKSQQNWRDLIARVRGENPEMKFATSAAYAIASIWLGTAPPPPPPPRPPAPAPQRPATPAFISGDDGKAWCGQCDRRVTRAKAEACLSRFCPLQEYA